MTATLSPADTSAKSLCSLSATVCAGDLVCYRDVYPCGDASLQEIVAAMQQDCDFLNPMVESGHLTVDDHNNRVVVATYVTDDVDFDLCGELTEVTAHFDDDSSEEIAV